MADADHAAIFERWMTEHRGIIVKIVRSHCATAADAEDLTQEIALSVWRSIPSFRSEAKPSTWIWRVALNRAISWHRRQGPRESSLDAAPEPIAHDGADDRARIDLIYQALRQLSPLDRSLAVLSLEGHSYAEMADITGLTTSNVGARLTRARTRLAKELELVTWEDR